MLQGRGRKKHRLGVVRTLEDTKAAVAATGVIIGSCGGRHPPHCTHHHRCWYIPDCLCMNLCHWHTLLLASVELLQTFLHPCCCAGAGTWGSPGRALPAERSAAGVDVDAPVATDTVVCTLAPIHDIQCTRLMY